MKVREIHVNIVSFTDIFREHREHNLNFQKFREQTYELHKQKA